MTYLPMKMKQTVFSEMSAYKIQMPYLPVKMEQRECSETSAYKIQTPGNYPEENIQQDIVVSMGWAMDWTAQEYLFDS